MAALQQFNECIDFQTRGIAFSSAEIGLSAGTISGIFKNRTTALVINAVVYDSKLLTCSLSSGDIKTSPDLTKRQAFPVKENFSIACQRSVQIDKDRPFFPPADVRIETNEGGYSARLAGDALNGYYLATEAKQKTEAAIAERSRSEFNGTGRSPQQRKCSCVQILQRGSWRRQQPNRPTSELWRRKRACCCLLREEQILSKRCAGSNRS